MSKDETKTTMHPNSLANLRPNTFSKEHQPKVYRGAPKGRKMKNLLKDILDRGMLIDDVISGAKRKVTIQEATLLTLVKAALVDQKPWAIEKLITLGMLEDLNKITIVQEISPAVERILAKAGVADEAKTIDGEVMTVLDE